MVTTASLAAATAAGLSTTLAPASASGLVFAAVRFHTVTAWPTSISRAAMALPMAPSPATPIRIRTAPDAFRRSGARAFAREPGTHNHGARRPSLQREFRKVCIYGFRARADARPGMTHAEKVAC